MICHDFSIESRERLRQKHLVFCMLESPLGTMHTIAYMPDGRYTNMEYVTRLPDFRILVAKSFSNETY